MITKTEKKLLLKLGQNIRTYRIQNNLSQFQLAIEAEIPRNQIGRIERAEINTSIITLHKIATVLKVDILMLLTL